MTDIRFYHMKRTPLEKTLPAILTKALAQGHKIVVKTPDSGSTEYLNAHLWSFDPNSFLPHGTEKDGHAAQQPIWLTEKDENPNDADVLILTGGASSNNVKDYKLCCEMLNGQNDNEIQNARQKWKAYKEEGLNVTYWQQNEKGAWEKKGA